MAMPMVPMLPATAAAPVEMAVVEERDAVAEVLVVMVLLV